MIKNSLKKISDETIQNHNSRHSTPTHQAPVMTVNVGTSNSETSSEPQTLLIQLEEESNKYEFQKKLTKQFVDGCDDKPPPPPIFFR